MSRDSCVVCLTDPSDGKALEIGTYKTSEAHSFTISAGDRVLVIDNDSAKLPPPGSEALITALPVRRTSIPSVL